MDQYYYTEEEEYSKMSFKDWVLITFFTFLGLFALVSCNYADDMKEPCGVITQIQKSYDGNIYVEIEFKFHGHGNLQHEWFLGSDTCKVGQVIKLQ